MRRTRRRLTAAELQRAADFHTQGLILMPRCAVCNGRSTEVHHVIDAQKLRSVNETRAWTGYGTFIDVYDLRNGLGLCELCHVRHTRAIKRVPRRNLRPENFDFARQWTLTWFIDRYYPEEQDASST